MGKEIDFAKSQQIKQENGCIDSIVELTDNVLLEARTNMSKNKVFRIPMDELGSLGTGILSLMQPFRTVTRTTTLGTNGLYKLANAAVGDTLKAAKNGNFWGAFRTGSGASKFAQLREIDTVALTTRTVVPINPATIMMAATLFSIEKKMDSIAKTEKQILSFLEIEKESEIEADIETLSAAMTKYKYSWDNEHFLSSTHKLVLDIQRTARKHINLYAKEAEELPDSKRIAASQSLIEEVFRDIVRKFKYYRLSLYVFSMASLEEILLSGNFSEENILCAKTEIAEMLEKYRDIFEKCSVYIENLSASSLKVSIAKSVSAAEQAAGKFFRTVPLISRAGEALQDNGKRRERQTITDARKAVKLFAKMRDPGVDAFVEKMDDMIQIYTHTQEIYFDDKQIYLITE